MTKSLPVDIFRRDGAAAGVQQPARGTRRGAALAHLARPHLLAQEHHRAGLAPGPRRQPHPPLLDRRRRRQHLPGHHHRQR